MKRGQFLKVLPAAVMAPVVVAEALVPVASTGLGSLADVTLTASAPTDLLVFPPRAIWPPMHPMCRCELAFDRLSKETRRATLAMSDLGEALNLVGP